MYCLSKTTSALLDLQVQLLEVLMRRIDLATSREELIEAR
jgi:hypothetical protein